MMIHLVLKYVPQIRKDDPQGAGLPSVNIQETSITSFKQISFFLDD